MHLTGVRPVAVLLIAGCPSATMAPKKDDKKAAPKKGATSGGGGKAKKKVRAAPEGFSALQPAESALGGGGGTVATFSCTHYRWLADAARSRLVS